MTVFKVDSHYQQATARWAGVVPPIPTDAPSLRRINDATMDAVMSEFTIPSKDTASETVLHYTSADGTTIPLHRFTPPSHKSSTTPGSTTPTPAILYIFGGGLVSGSVALFRKDISRYAAATGLPIFAPAYRLAPEAAFPKPVEDVYAALEWLRDHAAEQGIDAGRIAVMGISAGGGLAAAAALVARDRGFEPGIARLVLVYPMLDDRTRISEDDPLHGYLTWTARKNEIGWGAYLGSDAGSTEGGKMLAYAAAARATDLSGMPKTYIDVGELDLFRDECLAFGARLAAAGIDVESHLYPGVPHGWEWAAADAPVTKKAVENRIRALLNM
ncbi:hypothetical protein N0V88_002161 [Collariella sp. IMI 366227]|nr:hypothetical protein N0V88_002161 [Collariella sp. IMI 366227]